MNITTCIFKMNYQKNFIWSEWNQASFYLKKTFFDTAYCMKEKNYCVQTFEYEIAIQDKKKKNIPWLLLSWLKTNVTMKCNILIIKETVLSVPSNSMPHFLFDMYVEIWHLTLLIQNSFCIMIITLKWCITSSVYILIVVCDR